MMFNFYQFLYNLQNVSPFIDFSVLKQLTHTKMRENEPARFETRSFSQLIDHARSWKTEVRGMTTQGFTKISLMRAEKDRLNMYAISSVPGTNTQSIFSVTIPLELVEKAQVADRKFELKLKSGYNVDSYIRKTPPSAEFTLQCERQRSQVVTGISDYEIRNGKMILMAGDQLFRYNPLNEALAAIPIAVPDDQSSTEPMDISEGSITSGTKGCSNEAPQSSTVPPVTRIPIKKPTTSTEKPATAPPTNNFVSSAKVCPADSSLLAYVLNKQVYIEKNGKIIHRTSSNSKHITNGVPSYIVQEELERFEGIWWSESKTRLLYEHVNEEKVAESQFGVNGDPPVAPMKYPRAGTKNAYSTLRMVILENGKAYDVPLKDEVIYKHCPFYEYITRAGFFSDGTTVWVQVMSRDQAQCSLLLIPYTDFLLPEELGGSIKEDNHQDLQLSTDLNMGVWDDKSHEETMEKPPRGKLRGTVQIHKARNDYWINTHNAIYPLKITDEEHPMYEFIYCLEKPNGSCLALISAELDQNGYCRHTEEKLLMAENFSINKSMGIVVDEVRELVYYVANESHPTEWNICVSHYRTGQHAQLTESGICFKSERANGKLALDLDHGFACYMTSVGSPAECRFYSFRWKENEVLPSTVYAANITVSGHPGQPDLHFDSPEMIEFQSKKTGLMHYAMILRPSNFDPYKKYPVFHYVYGGPGIQIVHNDFSWIQYIRFCRLGYVVVFIDNRGSAHRGIEFERHIHKKMGTVEVEDQVEGLQMLAERTGGFMDMSRVVVHGWSYGGYMALQMIAKHPNIYRAAIAGGAVSDWRLYDTAYTERYMGYPLEEHVYGASSITGLVEKLPDEPNRLMLVHGLMDENVHFAHLTHLVDECIKKGKWHELVIFPNERHGVRNNDASIYLDARMMYFAQQAIQGFGPTTAAPRQGPL